ncbi:MAG: Fic family protein [Bacteroidia bacterium]|nr:Fic family protein [Bacteroidia bacterium]
MEKWYRINDALLAAIDEHLQRLSEKKSRLDQRRPLSPSALERIKSELYLEWNHHSNAIEGNTLTLNETKVVLQDGLTIGGKSLREHLEIVGHNEAIAFVEQLAHPKYVLNGKDILELHNIIMHQVQKDIAGRIRNGAVRISGANFIPPAPHKVPELFDDMIYNIVSLNNTYHPILISALLHHRFVWIHPFFDGNGRVARLVMNLLLMSKGYPPAIILKEDRKKYYDALNKANHADYEKFFLLILQAAERSMNIYLGTFPDADHYDTISNIVSEPDVPYNSEYVSLLARRGKIDAYKEGKNWYTSKNAIKEYISGRKRVRKLK